jgi:hypothetical protein
VPTVSLRLLYGFFVIERGRPISCTSTPRSIRPRPG